MAKCEVPGCYVESDAMATYENADIYMRRHQTNHLIEELSAINWYLMHLAAGVPLPLPPDTVLDEAPEYDTGSALPKPPAPSPAPPERAVRPPGTIIKRAEAVDD